MNYHMIRQAPKPWDLYDSRKRKCQQMIEEPKLIISITLWFNRHDNKNYSNYVMSEKNINFKRIKKNKGWHWTLNKSIVTIETKNHIRALIGKQIFTFVAIKTHAVVLPFNESNVLCMDL